MIAASGLRVAAQILLLPVIGRVLGPQAYGQVALVSPFIYFSMLFTEGGLGTCLVRADEVGSTLEGTVFSYALGLSAGLMVLFAGLGYPMGLLVHEPMFAPLLMALSGILLISSFAVVPGARLLRAKQYHWLAVSDAVSFLGSVGAVCAGLWLGWGVWSLVAQQVVLWLCKVAVLMAGAQWRPRMRWQWNVLRQYVHFGATLTGSSVLVFVARNLDNLLIGAFLGSQVLGYYALAFQLICLPQLILAGPVSSLLVPAASEAQRTGGDVSPRLLKVLKLTMLAVAPAMVGIAVSAPAAVPLLLGEKWLPIIPIIALLVPLGLVQTPATAMVAVLSGRGRAGVILRQTGIAAAIIVAGILGGLAFGSVEAVALGVSVAAVANSVLWLRLAEKEKVVPLREAVTVMAAPVAASLVMAAGVVALQWFTLTALAPLGAFLCSVAAGAALYAGALAVLFREHVAEEMTQVRQMVFLKRVE